MLCVELMLLQYQLLCIEHTHLHNVTLSKFQGSCLNLGLHSASGMVRVLAPKEGDHNMVRQASDKIEYVHVYIL